MGQDAHPPEKDPDIWDPPTPPRHQKLQQQKSWNGP